MAVKIDQSKPEEKQKPKFGIKDFIEFLKNTKTLIIFSIAIVSGNAVTEFVNSLVNGIITPAIGLIIPEGGYEEMTVKVAGSEFLVGTVLASAINMFIIFAVIYVLAKFVSSDEDIFEKTVVQSVNSKKR